MAKYPLPARVGGEALFVDQMLGFVVIILMYIDFVLISVIHVHAEGAAAPTTTHSG